MSPLANDLSNLPRAERADNGGGLTPDPEPRFVGVLAEAWLAQNEARGDKALAVEGARFRHSDAGKCARLIAYKAARITASDPMDLSGINNVSIGTILHEAWQEALRAEYDADIEVKVVTLDGDGAGHIDAVIDTAKAKVAYELKTIGGFSYKAAIGKASRGRPAEGPKVDHLLQGAINAVACDADELVIGYLAKEALSVNVAKGLPELLRFACEWTFTREQFTPLAERELKRVAGILALLDEGQLAARKVPDLPSGAEIVDVANSRWELHDEGGALVDTGTVWGGQFCSYCSHRSLCGDVGPGRVPVERAVEISTKCTEAA